MSASAACHLRLTRNFQSMDHGNTVFYTSLTSSLTLNVFPNLSLKPLIACPGEAAQHDRSPCGNASRGTAFYHGSQIE